MRKCPKCVHWIEKSSGCNHMTCKCGYEFCYSCGKSYGKCEHTGYEYNTDDILGIDD